MSLLLQLNAELRSRFPQDERRLHLLCCRRRQCSRKLGSFRAFREAKRHIDPSGRIQQKEDEKQSNVGTRQDLGSALFGGNSGFQTVDKANPFSSTNLSSATRIANPFSTLGNPSELAAKPPQRPVNDNEPPTKTFAETLKLSDPGEDKTKESEASTSAEPWPPNDALPNPFPTVDLDSDFEMLYPTEQPRTTSSASGPSKSQYDVEDEPTDNTNMNAVQDKDLYESSMDKTFQNFSDRLSHNPEQVLRYEFDGQPLLSSGTDAVAAVFGHRTPNGKVGSARGIPRCEACGAKRVFECQLVPGAISVLEKDDEDVDVESGMEWSTIIVGVCSENCCGGVTGEVIFREEWVGVQWEERIVKGER